MKKKFLPIILYFISFSYGLIAQDPDRNLGFYLSVGASNNFHTSVEYSGFSPLSRFVNEDKPGTATAGYTFEVGYFVIKKKLAVGLGYGIVNAREFDFFSPPLYLDLKYFLTEKRNTPLVFIQGGIFTKSSITNPKGNFFNIGIGQKVFFYRQVAALFSIAYNITDVEYKRSPFNDQNYLNTKGIELKIGLFF